MSESTVHIVNVAYEDQYSRTRLTLNNGTILVIPDSVLEELARRIPSKKESERIKELIEEIHQVRKNRIKEFAQLDKLAEDLAKKQDVVQSALGKCSSKLCVMQNAAKIKSITAQKALLQERRHLLKLTHIEEGDLRAQLAKLQRGEKQRKD